jgi:hypothetical protein
MAKTLKPETIETLIQEALAIEAEEAHEAGTVGFMARAMVQATMPHRNVKGNEFTRRNGHFTLTMLAPSKVGLPYGNIPRLLLAWITTEAVRTKERELLLGNSLSSFMGQLGFQATGGRHGSITRMKNQTRRLFSSNIQCDYETDGGSALMGFRIADKALLWWDAKDPAQGNLWQSSVMLTEPFFNEITTNPVPVDMRALKALKRSPLALDIYSWLTYRMSYLRHKTRLPWGLLQQQFGSDYPLNARGRADFKRNFLLQLTKVQAVYPVELESSTEALLLKPNRPHVRRLAKKG